MNQVSLFAGVVVAVLSSMANAQSFDLTLMPDSSATIQTDATLETVGILIGDYDETTNPEGTQTRTGFFGGSGNNPINASVDLVINAGDTTQPAGGLRLTLVVDAEQAVVEGLTLDLLNEVLLPADLTAHLVYETFHTVAPTMLYPGGIEIPLPLGQLGSLQIATMTQTDPATGVLTALDDPGAFEITALVPVELYLEIEVTLLGAEPTITPIGPVPAVLPLTGQVLLIGDDLIDLAVTLGPLEDSQVLPIGPLELPEIPLELPTLGTETAGVLLTLSADTLSIDTLLSLSIHAAGTASTCEADRNSDGMLNFFDVLDFLSDFTAFDPSADINGDSQFNFFDVQLYLAAFAVGCP